MAHLLGSESCINSLIKDVNILQSSISSMLKEFGPIKCNSWKYPTKSATDIDIEELLEDCTYCKDEGANQLAHIILFELVIDRLALLLRGVTQLFDREEDNSPIERPRSRSAVVSVSIGLIARMFLDTMKSTYSSYKDLLIELSDFKKKEDTINEDFDDDTYLLQSSSNKSTKRSVQRTKKVQAVAPLTKSVNSTMSLNDCTVDNSNSLGISKETQTYKSVFASCETCLSMQKDLIDAGTSIISICESQGLPSGLAKQRKIMKNNAMAPADVSRWASQQGLDLQCINSHLDNLNNQLRTSQNKLKKCEENNTALKNNMTSLQEEQTKWINKEKMLQLQMESDKQLAAKEKEVLIAKNETECSRLTRENESLNSKLNSITKSLEAQNEMVKFLEEERNQLTAKLASSHNDEKRVSNEMEQLQTELKSNQLQVVELETELKKLKAENKVLLKQHQSHQAKQAALLKRLDLQDNSQEELQERFNNLEVDNQQLQETIQKLTGDKRDLEAAKKDLEATVEELRASLNNQLQQYNQRTEDNLQQQNIRNTRDDTVYSDMQHINSLANNIQRTNSRYTHNIESRLSGSSRGENIALDDVSFHQTKQMTMVQNYDDSNSHQIHNDASVKPAWQTPTPPAKPRSVIGNKPSFAMDDKPSSAMDDTHPSTMGEKLHSDKSSFVCPDCDREYISERDLNIHRPFCYGRL